MKNAAIPRPRLRIAASPLLLSLLTLTLLATGRPVAAAEDFGVADPARRVHDRSGRLTTTELERIEEAAAAVTAAGAPTVVYLRLQAADAAATVQDAAELMEAWGIESAPGARDGLVLFVNLDPDDPGELDVGLWAGAAHTAARLPQRELERIVDDLILPRLREGQLAAGLLAGLDAAAADLRFGPPPPAEPGGLKGLAADFARWPLTLLAVGAGVAVWLLALTILRAHPAGRPQRATPTLQPPDRTPPAPAGALVAGRVTPALHTATLLDLAGRGALALEPAETGRRQQTQLLLVDESLLRDDYERAIWQALRDLADPAGVVGPQALPKLGGRLGDAARLLTAAMEARHWWDERLLARRRPLLWAGGITLALAVLGLVASLVGDEPFGLIAVGILVLAGCGALAVGLTFSRLTPAGQAAATGWRGFRAGLRAAKRAEAEHIDLDVALPYAVALGVTDALDRRLKAASAEGRVPLAFRQGLQGESWAGGFYGYWASFSATATPGSGGTPAGFEAGGAAAGGAGAGGST